MLKTIDFKIAAILSAIFVFHALLGAQLELSYDEAYYWVYSQYLSWGYFDHPPMVAIFIKAGTLLFGKTEFAVRAFFNLAMFGSIYLIWKMADAKIVNVLLMFFSMPLLYFSGVFALPDTPLLLFTLLFFYQLKTYLKSDTPLNVILLSLAIAAMFYSKYHGLLIIILTVVAHPTFLKRKSFWICALLVVVLYLPHIIWQYQHDFVSFVFHLTGRTEKHFDLGNIVNYVVGQIALMGLTLVPVYFFYRKRIELYKPFNRILLFNSVGFLAFLFLLSFRNQIEANWSITCGAALIILFAGKVVHTRRLFGFALIPILLGLTIKILLWNSETVEKMTNSTDNRLNEIIYWKEIRVPAIKDICKDRPIVADTYQIAAKVSFYTDQMVPALHINGRDSHYSLLDLGEKAKRGKFCYLSVKPEQRSVRIETNFKDPVYVVPETDLLELHEIYGRD